VHETNLIVMGLTAELAWLVSFLAVSLNTSYVMRLVRCLLSRSNTGATSTCIQGYTADGQHRHTSHTFLSPFSPLCAQFGRMIFSLDLEHWHGDCAFLEDVEGGAYA